MSPSTASAWRCSPSPIRRGRAPGEAIALLHRLGLKTVMATGDVEAVANHVAREVGIDRVIARATPADKLELVRTLQAEGRRVGMIGDGINDAPALAAADVGFAIGGGADIAVESADITLVGGDIARVAGGIELSRRPWHHPPEPVLGAGLQRRRHPRRGGRPPQPDDRRGGDGHEFGLGGDQLAAAATTFPPARE
jgi:hypothetical protein